MTSLATVRYNAVAMEFAAYLDAHSVEMHILTDTGETIAVSCPRDSIFAIHKHIEQMGRACPEIATWNEGHPQTAYQNTKGPRYPWLREEKRA